MDFDDRDLVREARAGSKVAFERLMRRHGPLVFRIAYGFTGDREAALDVAQDTFLKAHARLGDWREEGEFRSWIARIAAHEGLNFRRSRRRHPTCDLDEAVFLRDDPSQERAILARESREALHRSLAALPPRQRLAVVLRYFQGMSAREIGAALACSEGTARNLLFRSLRKLRSVLTGAEEALP